MLDRFNQHIKNNFSFLANAKLLVAISGGIDSVVLAHILHSLDYQIALAHVNFQLRGTESDKDEVFVKSLAEKLQVPIFVHCVNTKTYADEKKLSIQMAAREIRYHWFESILVGNAYEYILTAHHLDDNIETFFINLNRSSGLDGLIGIPEQNNKIIRPLLPFSREEIVKYAQQNKLIWREDASNTSNKYLRNKIRHDLLPVLQDINPDFRKAFSTSQAYLRESQSLVKDYISLLKPKILSIRNDLIYLSLKELIVFPNYKTVLYELLKEYGFTQWNDVYNLVNSQSGKKVFSNSHSLLKDREHLILDVINPKGEIHVKREIKNKFKIQNLVFNIKTVSINKINLRAKNTEYIDKSKIKFPLFVRKWQEGDYFYPLGMEGKKKISDFFIDRKISRLEKEKIWLLCDAQDQIIWVIGKRLDNRFKITKQTTEVLKIITNSTLD
jgi:tRNA(Ile)-lysidine synthase